MEHDFWHQRWSEGRIGFHQDDINSQLYNHWQTLEIEEGGLVFVPLCGKSRDLIWLREQGHTVVANELSDSAGVALFVENDLRPEYTRMGDFGVRTVERLQLFTGDFFALTETHVANVTAVYDRAALIALPDIMRQRYAQKMCEMLPQGVKMLLITLEFAGDSGPPFSVSEGELLRLYGRRFSLRRLDERVEGGRKEVCWMLVDKL